MNRYANYCTEEQAKKALELGAPIEVNVNPYGENRIHIPTTEQMIGWLADKKIFVHINCISDICYTWYISSKGYNKYGYTSDIKMRNTNKQACLDAIDVALEYLERWKK